MRVDRTRDQWGAARGQSWDPTLTGGTFFWLVVKLPLHDGGKETVTEQACRADSGGQRARRGWESKRESRGRSGAVLREGTGLPSGRVWLCLNVQEVSSPSSFCFSSVCACMCVTHTQKTLPLPLSDQCFETAAPA